VSGRVTRGVKISLFDVSVPEKPKETAVYLVDGQYSRAPVAENHKAFMFHPGSGDCRLALLACFAQGWFLLNGKLPRTPLKEICFKGMPHSPSADRSTDTETDFLFLTGTLAFPVNEKSDSSYESVYDGLYVWKVSDSRDTIELLGRINHYTRNITQSGYRANYGTIRY
jgi:hypothetical protein